jgi:hypothetical protein
MKHLVNLTFACNFNGKYFLFQMSSLSPVLGTNFYKLKFEFMSKHKLAFLHIFFACLSLWATTSTRCFPSCLLVPQSL